MDGLIEIEGYTENAMALERLLTSDAEFAKAYRKLIRASLREAKRKVGNSIRYSIGVNKDPRAAYKAVKTAVYKSLFGGNLSILSNRKASGTTTTYHAPRTLVAGQLGGNRVPMSARTIQVNSYYGQDRSFILRWLEDGTPNGRVAGSRGGRLHGNRGVISPGNVFSSVADGAMEEAVEQISNALAEYVNSVAND